MELARQPIKKRKPHFSLILFAVALIVITSLVVETGWIPQLSLTMSNSIVSSHGNTILSVDEEYALQLYMYNRRTSLIQNSSDVVDHIKLFNYFQDTNEMEESASWETIMTANESAREEYLQPFTNLSRSNLITGELCNMIMSFRETGGVKRHVFIGHWNENWGMFSDPVPNRTVDWGKWIGHFLRPNICDMDDLWWYLNHTNVSAIFTLQHQWLDHPKVFSCPLGSIRSDTFSSEVNKPLMNRTDLLLIAQSDFGGRPAIAERVIANFNGTIKNRFHEEGTNFFDLLRNAKFHLCPSGLGLDSYRNYETLAMGTIPIMETYYRRDGWYRTYDKLPVLWVDHFDNVTPALLEDQYPRILLKARDYEFERLTQQYWIGLINRYRFDPPPQVENVELQFPPEEI